MDYLKFLEDPKVSTRFVLDERVSYAYRVQIANEFLTEHNFAYLTVHHLETFDAVEYSLKSKVITYAAAFAMGAACGGTLYRDARRDLLTWRAIYEGARFANGKLAI